MVQSYTRFEGFKEEKVKHEIERFFFIAEFEEKNILECLKNLDFSGGKKLLDFGCGVGESTVIACNYNKNGSVTGFDEGNDFIKHANEYKNAHKINNVQYVEGEREKLPFENGYFDICFSRYVFQFLSNPDTALKELFRVTKPGGKIGIFEYDEGLTCYYPEPRHLQKFMEAKKTIDRFTERDTYIGRKLYKLLHDNELKNIKVMRLFSDTALIGHEAIKKSIFMRCVNFDTNHAFVRSNLISAQEIHEFNEDLEKLLASPDSFISFGGYFVYGDKP